MADQEYAVVQDLAAIGNSTDWLRIINEGMRRAFFAAYVRNATSKVLAIDIKRPGDPDGNAQPINATPPSASDPYQVYTIVGDFDVRLRWVSGGTGTLNVVLTR